MLRFSFNRILDANSTPWRLLRPVIFFAVNPKVIGSIAFPFISFSNLDLKNVPEKKYFFSKSISKPNSMFLDFSGSRSGLPIKFV